jgi:hypothetical protein
MVAALSASFSRPYARNMFMPALHGPRSQRSTRNWVTEAKLIPAIRNGAPMPHSVSKNQFNDIQPSATSGSTCPAIPRFRIH